MRVQDFTVMERPGERTKAMPDGLRISMNRKYAADLVRRISESLAENEGDVDIAMFGEIIEA